VPATPAVPDGKRPTLADVAARAGVSTALVSIVMREANGASAATRERVLKAARGDRLPARLPGAVLRSNRSRLLGVQFGLRHPFHTDLVEGIYAAAEPAGYQVALSAVAPSRGERQAVETLLGDRCEALILLGPQAPAARLAELAAHLPVVSVARRLRPPAAGRGRRPHRRRRGCPPGRRPSGGPRPSRHRPHRRRQGARRRRPAPRLPHRHAPPRSRRPRACAARRADRGGRRHGRPHPARSTPGRGPPPSSPSTTAAPRASSTPSCAPACPSPTRSPWSASTTPPRPASPTSTSPPSARTSPASPNSPSAGPSHGWTARSRPVRRPSSPRIS
jgi:hypothetical protein